MKIFFSPIVFSLIAFFLFPTGVFAQNQQIAVAIHVHSEISSGVEPIEVIAQKARDRDVGAVIITDLLHETYEYGLQPFPQILKKTVERNSISKLGVKKYLERIRKANQDVPEVLIIDGAVITPFYYWSGNPWPGPLILNGRGKDLIAFGLKDPAAYENIPIVGKNNSGFDAYHGEQGAIPYQKVIDYTAQNHGFILWSHATAHEEISFRFPVLGTHVYSISNDYRDELLKTQGYDGMGVYSVELAQIDNPQADGLSQPGATWDHLLQQYCSGNRKKPVWAVGEVDYTGIQGGNTALDAILNILWMNEKTPDNVLKEFSGGRYYLIIPGKNGQRRLVLNGFCVAEATSEACMGGEVKVSGPPILRFRMETSDHAEEMLHLSLIRNGELIDVWDQEAPFTREFKDETAPVNQKSYYRLIASSTKNDHLLSNPVFFLYKPSAGHEN